MAEKGLGMGLGALLGEEAPDSGPRDFEYVSLSRLEPRPGQPRTVFDDEKIQELADSVSVHGVLQPLTVRPIKDGYFQIIAGERRWRAARLAGLDKVPVRVIEADDRKTAELALIENLQREDLNPLEEARGYRDLITVHGLTQEEAAAVVGKSRSVIANAIRLLNLPERVLALLEDGALAPGAARALLALPSKDLQIQVAEKTAEEGLSVRQVEELVRRLNRGKGRSKGDEAERRKNKNPSIYIDEICRELEQSLGRRVRVTGGGRKGKIELEYYDADDFEQLYALLRRRKGRG